MIAPFSRFNWVKALQLLIGLAVSTVVVGSYTLDLWAKRRVGYFESAFSEAMKRPVSIRKAGFDPLYGFYFEDFQLRELKTAPRPLSIGRLEAHTRILLWPEPTILIHKLVFVRPDVAVDVHPEDLFRSQLWLKRVPYLETRVGHLKFLAKLDAVEAYDGKISILSKHARQDFEKVRFYAGKRWRAPQSLLFEGRAVGAEDARFKIDCGIRPGPNGELEAETRMDFKHFTTAYLAPFLEGRFELPDRHLTGSLRVSVAKQGVVRVTGRIALPHDKSRSWALWENRPFEARLKIEGRRELERVLFDDFTLRLAGINVTGSGSVLWKRGRESWQASVSAQKVPAEKIPALWTRPWKLHAGTADFSMRVSGDARGYSPETTLTLTDVGMKNAAAKWSIERATGTLKILKDRMEMRELWLFYNDLPMRLNGRIAFGENGRIALEGQTHPSMLPELKAKNPVTAAFRLAAVKKHGLWNGAARLSLSTPSAPAAQWTLSLRGWQIQRSSQGRWETAVRHLLVRSDGLPAAPGRGPLRIDGLRAEAEISPKRTRIFLKDGRLADGKIAGYFSWKESGVWKAHGRLRGESAERLARTLDLRYPLHGVFDGSARAYGHRLASRWSAAFRIRNGRMGPSAELQKLSEGTGIESLNPLRFTRFFGRARSNGSVTVLDGWSLEGKDVRLTADAQIRGGAMAGRMTASFPLRVVKASSGLAWLARFVGEYDALDFDFRVAGRMEKLRAHWMAGAFRDKIEKRLAPWMRAEFTRQIEKHFADKPPALAA